MAHVLCYDMRVKLLQRVFETLLFVLSVTWWISRRISDEWEDCCDDVAVAGFATAEIRDFTG